MNRKTFILATTMLAAVSATAEAQTLLPIFNGFEQGLDGWTAVDADGDGDTWQVYDFSQLPPFFAQLGYSAYEGVKVAMSTASGIDDQGNEIYLNPDNWLMSPEIAIGDEEQPTLSWWVKDLDMEGSGDRYEVRLSLGGSDVADFDTVLYSELTASDSYVYRSVDLTAWAGQTVRVAFRHHNSQGGASLAIDAIGIGDSRMPVVTLNAPATAFAGDSVCLSVGIASTTDIEDITWTVETDTTGGTLESSGTDSVLCLSWDADAPEGGYMVRVSVTNAYGTATDSALVELRRCDAVDSMPYVHTFGTDEICWTTDGWTTDEYTLPYGGSDVPAAVSFSTDFMGQDLHTDVSLVSPHLLVPDDDVYELKYIVAEGADAGDRYAVVVHTDGAADTLVDERLGEGMPLLRKLSLAPYGGQEIQVEFRHFDSPTGYALMLAAVEVRQLTAPEVTIEVQPVVRTTDDVQLRARVVSAAEVDYNWTLGGATPATATDSTVTANWAVGGTYTVSVDVSNNAGQVTATAQVTVIECPSQVDAPLAEQFENGIGCWTAYDADGDGLCWTDVATSIEGEDPQLADLLLRGQNTMISFSTYPEYGLVYMMSYGIGAPLNSDNWLISPDIALPEGQSWLSWSTVSLGEMQQDLDSYEVLLALAEGGAIGDFTVTLRPLGTAPGDAYRTFSADLSAYAGQVVRIAFRHRTQGRMAMMIDDIVISATNPVGIDASGNVQVCIYPTLASDRISVEATGLRHVDIIDLGGRTLLGYDASTDRLVIDISDLPAATYIMRATTDSGVAVKRFVKQ